MLIAVLLSQYSSQVFFCGKISSLSSFLIQMIFVIFLASPLNFASVLDGETTLCFLFFHVTRFPLNKVTVTRDGFSLILVSFPTYIGVGNKI